MLVSSPDLDIPYRTLPKERARSRRSSRDPRIRDIAMNIDAHACYARIAALDETGWPPGSLLFTPSPLSSYVIRDVTGSTFTNICFRAKMTGRSDRRRETIILLPRVETMRKLTETPDRRGLPPSPCRISVDLEIDAESALIWEQSKGNGICARTGIALIGSAIPDR